jgi:hypothetical protein
LDGYPPPGASASARAERGGVPARAGLSTWRSATYDDGIMLRLAAVVCVAALAAGAGASRSRPIHASAPWRFGQGPFGTLTQPQCPAQMLPDGDACVHLPGADTGAPQAEAVRNAHRDRWGRLVSYDEIPRRPDRPAEYDRYRFPVSCEVGCVDSGYDLDRLDSEQRQTTVRSVGAEVGHGAIDLPQRRGAPVTMLRLEHQEGDAQVVYVGPLFGSTVVSRHTLREGGQFRDYLLLFAYLDTQGPWARVGSILKEGDIVGLVGDTGSPHHVHLHLEVRRVRSGVTLDGLAPEALIASENSVACDPRNVLPLKSDR